MNLATFTPATVLITIALLGLAPFVAVMVTSFTKIVVTLSLLRNALGLQQTPPNLVINGVALILSIYVMYPVGLEMRAAAETHPPAAERGVSDMLAYADAAKEPLRTFLVKHASERERTFFLRTAQRTLPPERAREMTSRDFVVAAPAFVLSELTQAFQIGFLIYLPFLVIDLVVANILLAMGMMMMSPTTVSLPFKLLLFVMIDGWVKLAHSLVLSYQ